MRVSPVVLLVRRNLAAIRQPGLSRSAARLVLSALFRKFMYAYEKKGFSLVTLENRKGAETRRNFHLLRAVGGRPCGVHLRPDMLFSRLHREDQAEIGRTGIKQIGSILSISPSWPGSVGEWRHHALSCSVGRGPYWRLPPRRPAFQRQCS
jgi:hypothetical protein